MSADVVPSNEQLPTGITPDQKLRAFVRALFDEADWPEGGDIDGFAFQELAVEHGLLIPETRTEPCCDEESCHCAQYHGAEEMKEGVTCYRKVAWLNAARPVETKAPLHLPPDGTRDGDGTWRDGKWYPDVPDNHVQRANDPDAEEHLTVVSDEGLCRETTVREFLGWLSGHLPELHKVEVPRLAAAWEEYKGVVEAAVRDGVYL